MLFINIFMTYLTTIYKHKCEQLQEQINNIKKLLNEAEATLPTIGIPSLTNELGYAPPTNTPSQSPTKPTQPTQPSKPSQNNQFPKPTIPNYPWPGAPRFPPQPTWMSNEEYQKLLRNFQPYSAFPTPKPPRDGDIGWGPEGSDNYQKYLKEFEQWINDRIKAMQTFTTEYERNNPRPTDITSEAYARWLAAWISALNQTNTTYNKQHPVPTYIPMPRDNR